MAAEDFQVRLCLQEITKLDLEIKALIQDIRECAVSTDILDDLNTEARGKITKLRKKIEYLEQLGQEQETEEDRQILHRDSESHRNRLANTITSLRQAYLTAQFSIDKTEKEELLNGGSAVRKRGPRNKESLAKAASNITESLMGINRKLTEQLQHSENTKSTLMRSSNTIGDTQEEIKSQGGHIKNAHNLLTKYNRRQLTDKLLIFLALVFFFATVLYIVKKRIW